MVESDPRWTWRRGGFSKPNRSYFMAAAAANACSRWPPRMINERDCCCASSGPLSADTIEPPLRIHQE